MIKAKKSLGQNFLSSPRILDKIVAAGEIGRDDIVLEIGPGLGSLTEKLAEKAGRVIAIEKDHRLIELLKEKFKNTSIEIVEGDILKLRTETLTGNWKLETGNFKIVANIPYYITSHLLKIVFDEWPKPKLTVLMVQKEVAQRIVAKPPDMNLLALSVQYYCLPEIVSYVAKGNFRPIPKVDSAILKLTTNSLQPTTEEAKQFFGLIKAGFSGKRKQLAGNIAKNLDKNKDEIHHIFEKAGLINTVRAEELSLGNWLALARAIY